MKVQAVAASGIYLIWSFIQAISREITCCRRPPAGQPASQPAISNTRYLSTGRTQCTVYIRIHCKQHVAVLNASVCVSLSLSLPLSLSLSLKKFATLYLPSLYMFCVKCAPLGTQSRSKPYTGNLNSTLFFIVLPFLCVTCFFPPFYSMTSVLSECLAAFQHKLLTKYLSIIIVTVSLCWSLTPSNCNTCLYMRIYIYMYIYA